MEAYSDFARVYDIFMDNVEYEKWAEYLIESLKEYGIEDGIVLELGCGTGVMTELLAESGYDMIGVDNSEEMLGEAMEKRAESGHEILYLEQDMREFELYGTVRAVVSVCDCMNYITEEDDLLTVFKLVNNYLDPDGIFYRNGMGDLIYKSDSDLHVCFLQSSVGSAESLIDLGLDILCLVDQLHHFADQDIPFFIHQLKSLTGEREGILGKN